ncbi:MAG: hypothetical protein HQM16_00420 [Deltaproteobacteria bacterium]|nr:hypothetical protein [Deltaproteobacteria bacterium]
MKPIPTKIFLVQYLLFAVAITIAVLGLVLSAKQIPFYPSVEATTTDGEPHITVITGLMPLSHMALFISFICLYLVFEFYGFKSAFYASLNTAGMVLLSFFLLMMFKKHSLDPETSQFDTLLDQLINYRLTSAVALSAAIASGFTSIFVLAFGIKKLTRNYLMFIRFPVASIIGFGVFCAVDIFISQFNTSAYVSMILDGITPFSRFTALVMFSVIPLYILRLVLGLFRGMTQKATTAEDTPLPQNNGLFRGPDTQDSQILIEDSTREDVKYMPIPIEEQSGKEATEVSDNRENTTSEKIRIGNG